MKRARMRLGAGVVAGVVAVGVVSVPALAAPGSDGDSAAVASVRAGEATTNDADKPAPDPKPTTNPDPKPTTNPDPKPTTNPDPKPTTNPDPKPTTNPDPKPEPTTAPVKPVNPGSGHVVTPRPPRGGGYVAPNRGVTPVQRVNRGYVPAKGQAKPELAKTGVTSYTLPILAFAGLLGVAGVGVVASRPKRMGRHSS